MRPAAARARRGGGPRRDTARTCGWPTLAARAPARPAAAWTPWTAATRPPTYGRCSPGRTASCPASGAALPAARPAPRARHLDGRRGQPGRCAGAESARASLAELTRANLAHRAPSRAGTTSTIFCGRTRPSWPKPSTRRRNGRPLSGASSTTMCVPPPRPRCCFARSGIASSFPRPNRVRRPSSWPIGGRCSGGSLPNGACCSPRPASRRMRRCTTTAGGWPGRSEPFLEYRGHWQELIAAAERRPRPRAAGWGTARARRTRTAALGRSYTRLGRFDDARTQYGLALDLYGALGDDNGKGRTHSSVASLYEQQSRYDEMLHHAQQALAFARSSASRAGQAYALGQMERTTG